MKMGNKKAYFYLSFALSAALAIADALPARAAEYPYSQYMSGENARDLPESENGYTLVSLSTEAQLLQLAQDCRLDSWSRDKYIRLENDIALSEDNNIIIPCFAGIFEGNGHTISGLQITASGSALGLFRYIQSSGTVQNLTVSGDVLPDGDGSRCGILAGANYGRILNCSVNGRVKGSEETGGICGINEASGEIRGSSSSAAVTGEHYTGGICGINKGTLNNCTNTGAVNTHSTNVSYSLEDITLENLQDFNSTENMAAHTDTGGITGYSEGKIYYCTNSGTVGYQHVGYNTGGIAGRLHQGYIQSCTNTGHILGRKDVGGIAGQMEPFLEIQYLNDKLSEIDREAELFCDLLEASNDDLRHYSQEASGLAGEISTHLTNASSAAGNLLGTGNDLWYLFNQELTGISSDLSRLNQEMEDLAASDRDKADSDTDENPSGGGQAEPPNEQNESSDGNTSWTAPDIDIESYIAALRRFGDSAGSHIANITGAANDRSGGINDNLNTLDSELHTAGGRLQELTDVLGQSGDNTSSNIDALLNQAKALQNSMNELRDELFRYEGISIEDASDEAAGSSLPDAENSFYDTTSFQQGKITLCVNSGGVDADTNVGGIVGQIATEYDFDPEDDITLTGAESFNLEQTVKAVVRESRNQGNITCKKDYVGGIVGKADNGAVISCESYGSVSTTGGSYAGGIAGYSGYCVRSCFFMGPLSGKDYVGGIVGSGSDVFYSYAYPETEHSGNYVGSIAGQLKEDGMLYGNYYVQGNIPGVDSIGYEDGAAPLDYETFCSREEVPDAFREFTVCFQADGTRLAAFQCRYGESLDKSLFPDIPEKEGCYGTWPDFDYDYITGNQVLEARYERWISSLASSETSPEGRPMLLVQGEFLPENRLVTETFSEGTRLSVAAVDTDGNIIGQYEKPVQVRALYTDSDTSADKAVIELWNGETYMQVPAKVIGNYLEFEMEQPGIFRITVPQDHQSGIVLMTCAGIGILLLLIVLVRKLRKRKKK